MSETTTRMTLHDDPPTAPLRTDERSARGPERGWATRMLRDTGYCLTAFPLAVPAFVLVVAGLSLGLSLVLLVVGLPVLAATAYVARGSAHLERQRVRAVTGRSTPAPVYASARPGDGWLRRVLAVLRDPQSWLDMTWALVGFVTGTAVFSIVVSWLAAAVGGLTYWFWQRFISFGPDNVTLAELIGLGRGRTPEIWLNTGLGVLAVLTFVPVARLAATLNASLGHVLLSSRAELQEQMSHLQGGRAAGRVAEADALRRLERDIHDGPQQRLVRLSIDIGRARKHLESDPDAARGILDDAQRQARETVDELRSLSRGIAPPLLVDRGLAVALREVANRSPVPVDLAIQVADDLPVHVQTAAYFVVSEGLTNVAKHAGASSVSLAVWQGPDHLFVRIEDDGCGGAHQSRGHGLAGLDQRVRAVDGRLTVSSPVGGPTTIEAEIACG